MCHRRAITTFKPLALLELIPMLYGDAAEKLVQINREHLRAVDLPVQVILVVVGGWLLPIDGWHRIARANDLQARCCRRLWSPPPRRIRPLLRM